MAYEVCICCRREGGWANVTTLPPFLFGVPAKIVRCSNCGLGKTLPSPSPGSAYYQHEGRYVELFANRSNVYRDHADQLLAVLDDLLDPASNRLLDLGCGGGFLVEAARARGYLSQGIEANHELVQWCRNRGLDVRFGDVTNLQPREVGQHDVVVLSSMLEHVPRPDLLLRAAGELLHSGGLIVLSQATYDGLLPQLFPWSWYGWQPREHYWHFTPGSLGCLADRLGFRAIRVTRISLHHPWFVVANPLVFVGRNLAAYLARIGTVRGRGDSFYMVLAAE